MIFVTGGAGFIGANFVLDWLPQIDEPIVNIDQLTSIERFCTNLPDADLEAMIGMAEEATELIERNVNTRLVLTVLAQSFSRALRGSYPEKLYLPLAEDLDRITG